MSAVLNLLNESWTVLVLVFVTTAELLGIASAWHAMNKVRTSQAAVAWAVGLVAMPILVLPLYWVFGQKRFAGYRDAIRQVGEQCKASVEAVRRELMTGKNAGSATGESPLDVLADVLDTPLSYNNAFRLLIDGESFFDTLFEQIRSAKNYIYIEFYIIRDDDIGRKFAEALCERAQAGVVVRLLYDEVGCMKLTRAWLRRVRDAGVDVLAFNTRQGWANRFQLNFRNHRKLVVIDGQRTIVGGLNIGDEYLGRISWVSRWRDTAIHVDGAVVRKIQAVFASDYYWATRRNLPEAVWSTTVEAPVVSDDQHGMAAVCATGPADGRMRATMMFATIAGCARKRLWISSPYLVPDDSCMTALSMAQARGIDVRILIPEKADSWLVFLAGFYYEQQLESLGIPVYRYCSEGFMHQKCVLADDNLVLIGSTNLDNRSLHLNFELMLAVADPALVQEAAQMLEQDFAVSDNMNASHGQLRPWYIRTGTIVARLFSPVL
ncbi:cardiolipin synthase [Nitrosomonas cryotolerans]|uniref:Cardiolipin synthase n=1 Tax=Nitrosomonas cryotolerans ATCC 49181 TaxID=1131553 RepID=A0A1N6HFT9_9PROT|nr:cardiolipin synthase [Nitrosomonas cryotolerans]SFQ13869.1 cardiolipin synthase [Nitrosomonas cryotolerans]SIO18728.1 cardiolipin synthase [Nitrosomonas cryotolerans ATCC 49181]